MSSPPPRDYTAGALASETIELRPIGWIRSPHKERHGTPRQPVAHGEVAARSSEGATVELDPSVIPLEGLDDLIGFDRIWILAHFHLNHGWKPRVVPPMGPRLQRGLLATRSPHRPNGIALSCCELRAVEGHRLILGSVDLLDGTPVLDIKPYIPFADAFPSAAAGWVDELDL